MAMAASLRSSMNAHENIPGCICDHRHYLGLPHSHHRARSPSLNEFPDSPSVYSHVYQSPNPDVHCDAVPFSRPSDPPSNLEFDDETVSTICSLSTGDVQDDPDVDDHTDDASHRISVQGPKIRFHSRPPWETDGVIPHDGESETGSRSATIGIRGKLKGKASRADSLIRTFTRGSSTVTRPSFDSACSQISATSSFEITAGNYSSSHGALYDLAGQSVSTASLSSATSTTSVRCESFARATNYPKFSHYLPHTVGLDEKAPPLMTLESPPMPSLSFDTSRVSDERSAKSSQVPLPQGRQSNDKFIHPYANPDLVVLHSPFPETIAPQTPILDMGGSDSNNTVTDSTSTRSAAFSIVSTEMSTTSSYSHGLPHGKPRVNGKEISSPVSVLRQGNINYVDRDTRFMSLHPPPTGFDGEDSRLPTVTLISLQEAQARERFRSNTIHTTVARSKPLLPNSEDVPESREDQTEEMHAVGVVSRTHTRSTSIGAQHNTTPLPLSQSQIIGTREESAISAPTSAAPRRALKHKKSGFMRLFGGRNSEGEKEMIPPPPIPPLGDVHTESQIHGIAKPSKILPAKMHKPPFSLPLSSATSDATLVTTSGASSNGDGPDMKGHSLRRRQPPSLSIVTKASDHSISTSVTGRSSPAGLNFTTSPPSLTVPQSAPPGSGDFPGLKLRPVSTSFSSHFAGFVTDNPQRDVDTPSSVVSLGTALSPFTPVSTRCGDDTSSTAIETPGGEHLTIKQLQDQLASAKKAWQQQVSELRGQIKDLTYELEDLRAAGQVYCEVCGRGEPQRYHTPHSDEQELWKVGIISRPRTRTGDPTRFANGN